MNQLNRLTKKDIIENYIGKPILVEVDKKKEWYLITYNSGLPSYMINQEDYELLKTDKTACQCLVAIHDSCNEEYKCYLLWRDFDKSNGWMAYGY